MIHPRNEIDKVYLARVKGIATKENLRPLTRGVVIDGKKTQPAHYNIIKVDHEKNRSVVELTIHEGRNHQDKKMFESVGLIVTSAAASTFNNIGPLLGTTDSFAIFSPLSKLIMGFAMIAGRLEIYPLLLLFLPKTWSKI